ncbi:MAG: hypothetical protein FDW93_03510 [Bergeyella sp.]|nr:hypothetical protein [Bergeyella sp.]
MKTFRHAAFGVFSLLLLVSCSETFKEDSIREYNLFFCIASFAGGIFGAAISGNMAFGFTGFLILIGIPVAMITGNTVIIDYVAFGPVFGPHISFAGGVAAAAYAAKKK